MREASECWMKGLDIFRGQATFVLSSRDLEVLVLRNRDPNALVLSTSNYANRLVQSMFNPLKFIYVAVVLGRSCEGVSTI